MSSSFPHLRLKRVCIGAGDFSHFQYEAWLRISEVEIVALSNRDPARATEITAQLGLTQYYADYREMPDRKNLDFVDVIAPTLSRQAICQKARVPSLATARAIVADADRAGVRFMVHENFRIQLWRRETKRQLAAGTIGAMLHSLCFRSLLDEGCGETAYIPRQPCFRNCPRLLEGTRLSP